LTRASEGLSPAEKALQVLGCDEAARARMIAALLAYEQLPDRRFTNVRDEVTGPVVDALHGTVDIVRKGLSNGLVFEFPYRSKIARDFVMSVPSVPDHVWEPQTTKTLLHLSRGVTDVIVGGAYFGDQAILVADALRGRGACHAFEADADQARMLERNAALNRLDNVRVNAVGLWSDCESRLSFVGEDALASTIASATGIGTITIDAYSEASGAKPGLIMLDLEGSELEVLRGAERLLSGHGPHLVFEVHRSYVDWSRGLPDTEIARYLASFGYTMFAVRDFQSNYDMDGRPIELVPIGTVWLEGPPHGFNVLAVKDEAVVAGEPFRIIPDVSPKLLLHRDPALHHPAGGL
jgi:FkbM family methyltransferase